MLVLIASIVLGVGGWLILVGLDPTKPTLTQLVTASQDPVVIATAPAPPPVSGSWSVRYGARATGLLARLSLPGPKARANLALLERAVEPHLAQKASAAVAGALIPLIVFGPVAALGFRMPPLLPLAVSAAFAGLMFVVPDLALRDEAERFRMESRTAVRLFLDLTVASLAGGAGIEQAMNAAARRGRSVAFRRIREAMAEARRHQAAAWPYLDALGVELGLRELSELAATAALAGSEGAKVRASLAAKARSMREREHAIIIAAEASATERGSLPGMVQGLALTVFILYASLAAAATAL
ncbi:tight adherence protein C [Catenulispora sp. GAS73]|uniref:type II secretion system F family protein n=1 Tax=Catenulispora sp. GAS73 TaxID=3156269 RepID=UPI003510EC6A